MLSSVLNLLVRMKCLLHSSNFWSTPLLGLDQWLYALFGNRIWHSNLEKSGICNSGPTLVRRLATPFRPRLKSLLVLHMKVHLNLPMTASTLSLAIWWNSYLCYLSKSRWFGEFLYAHVLYGFWVSIEEREGRERLLPFSNYVTPLFVISTSSLTISLKYNTPLFIFVFIGFGYFTFTNTSYLGVFKLIFCPNFYVSIDLLSN